MSDLAEKQKHLEALEAFLASPAHDGFVVARGHDIQVLKESILMVEPVSRETEIEGFKLRGELRYAEQMVKTFEDARVSLKERIDKLIERQLEERENTKT